MARIFVVGAGVVGTAVGRAFVEAGHAVTLVDLSPARVDALVASGLDATTQLDLRGEPSSFVFLTVPTPAGPQGYDLRAVASASRDVGVAIGQAHAERGAAGRHSSRRDARTEGDGYAVHTVVTRSTVPPGTTTQLVGPTVARASGTAEGAGFVLAANPEFLRGESAEDDVRWPRLTVVGARSRRVAERLAALLAPFGGDLRLFDSPETAELVKCAHDLYTATRISFWNEMALVAGRLGIDAGDVATTVAGSAEACADPARSARAGAPFTGRCLEKDADGFLAFARELGLGMPLLGAVVGVNRELVASPAADLRDAARGRVLDLREAERQEAAWRPSPVSAAPPERHQPGQHQPGQHQPGQHQPGQSWAPAYDQPAGAGWPVDGAAPGGGWSRVPGTRDPVSGDLPALRASLRDPFTGDLGLDLPDDRW